MSAEKITIIEDKNISSLVTPEEEIIENTGRVDINCLLARARKQKQKENFTNLVFFGLIAVVLLVFGIILSF